MMAEDLRMSSGGEGELKYCSSKIVLRGSHWIREKFSGDQWIQFYKYLEVYLLLGE
jgi:hypothetical protein